MNESGKNHVLIVDDESVNLIALTKILSPEYNVLAVKNGPDAIKMAETQQPDVILLDIVMPDMDGYDVIIELKKAPSTRNIPVIFVTGLSDVDDEEKGLTLGEMDYITKPFSSGIVKLRVRNQIQIRNQIQTIQKIMESLEAASNAKIYFLGNMSHDFKTPLTVISLLVQNVIDMLETELDIDEALKSLVNAHSEVMRMARIADGALKHSFLYDNRKDMSSLDIARLLRSGAATYHILLERNNNKLEIDIPDSLPNIMGNTDMLLLIMSNLVSNANRHTRNGLIRITASVISDKEQSSEQNIYVAVEDNGSGVRADLLPHIFKRGVSEGSTGLGLSICQSNIETHNGKIGIESEEGSGTKVWFTIPVAEN
jgi:signal transduction histidine kinase